MTTETACTRTLCDSVRGSVPMATCTVGAQGGRLLVLWRAPDRRIWEEIFLDFRRTFPRHADAISRGRGKGWSLPMRQRRRLGEWLDRWFSAEQIAGSLEEPPVPATPAAGEILRLLGRREELRRAVRQMPQRGPIGRQIARELGLIERQVAEIAAGTGEVRE